MDRFEGIAHGLASALRGRLASAAPEGEAPGQVIAFVAARTGEGVSSVARATAMAMTDMVRHPTLLLDLDEAGGQAAALKATTGTLLADEADVPDGDELPWRLVRVTGRRLWVNDGPALMLSTPGARLMDGAPDLAEAIPVLRRRFAWSLLDIPALDRSSMVDRIVAEADLCVPVVAAESTRGMAALALRDRIVNAGGTILGAVMTQRRFHIPERIYRWL